MKKKEIKEKEKENEFNYYFSHLCITDYGSSGSPIFLKDSQKVIGIHIGGSRYENEKENHNNGIFIKYPILGFIEKLDKEREKKIKDKNEKRIILKKEKTPRTIKVIDDSIHNYININIFNKNNQPLEINSLISNKKSQGKNIIRLKLEDKYSYNYNYRNQKNDKNTDKNSGEKSKKKENKNKNEKKSNYTNLTLINKKEKYNFPYVKTIENNDQIFSRKKYIENYNINYNNNLKLPDINQNNLYKNNLNI